MKIEITGKNVAIAAGAIIAFFVMLGVLTAVLPDPETETETDDKKPATEQTDSTTAAKADSVVINKPRNLVVHPGNGVQNGTLAAGLLYHFKENLSAVNGPLRPGIVHRLDKDTPGLMVVAKNDAAHRHLAHQLSAYIGRITGTLCMQLLWQKRF